MLTQTKEYLEMRVKRLETNPAVNRNLLRKLERKLRKMA